MALARVEEEKLIHDAIQSFYKERIETTRSHAGMSPLNHDLSEMTLDEEASDLNSEKDDKTGHFIETSLNTTNAT